MDTEDIILSLNRPIDFKKLGRPKKNHNKNTTNMVTRSFSDVTITTKTVVVKTNLKVSAEQWKAILNHNNDKLIVKDNKFKNCLSITLLNLHQLSIKIFFNGSFQLTGCKDIDMVHRCVDELMDLLNPNIEPMTTIHFNLIPSMTNIRFSLGYRIDLDETLALFNQDEEFFAIRLPRNPGLNIKIMVPNEALQNIPIETVKFVDDVKAVAKDTYKHPKTNLYITIFLYTTGNVVMSGVLESVMEVVFEKFMDRVNHNNIRQ